MGKMQILEKIGLKAWKMAHELGQQGVIDAIHIKGLLGRGGACFPAAKKWQTAFEQNSSQKYLICNADEGEPGTFKDKFIIMNNPDNLIEGMIIACYAIGADKAYIYLRREYRYLEKGLRKKIDSVLRKAGSDITIDIILGAGAYICGEETSIINSIQGRRGQPYYKPPYPAIEGLFGKPTVVSNVETLANVPLAIAKDDWDSSLRLFSLSGSLNKPGVYEVSLGSSIYDILALGEPKEKIKAIYFGCAGGCMPVAQDVTLDIKTINSTGCMLGSCTMIAVGESQSIVDIAVIVQKFFEFESCGKCTPCREGNMRALALLQRISLGFASRQDIELLKELAEVMRDSSLCGLGKSAPTHILTSLRFFREEFEKRCGLN